MNRTLVQSKWFVVMIAWMCIASASIGEARPPGGPVAIEHSPIPAGVSAGSEVTATLTFRALANIDRLEVSVSPFKGLRVISEPTRVAFATVKSGDALQLRVTVHVMDAKMASLAVTYRATIGDRTHPGAVTIEFV